MSWDTTTNKKALFETALDKENLPWEEFLLDESGEFHDSEMPDTTTRPLNLDEEVNSPTNDDGDLPFPEPLRRKTITVKTRHKWKNRILSPRNLEMLYVSRCGFLNVA